MYVKISFHFGNEKNCGLSVDRLEYIWYDIDIIRNEVLSMYYVMLKGSVSGHQVQWQVAFTDSIVEGLQEDYMQEQADAHENGEYFEYTRFEEYLVHSARSAVLRGVRRTYGSDMQHHTSIEYSGWSIEREEQIENDPAIVKQLSEKVIQY